jgi:hypothetical protein
MTDAHVARAATVPPDLRTPYSEGEASALTIIIAALRGVATGADVVNIRRRRRVAEQCHYHHRHRHRNDSG